MKAILMSIQPKWCELIEIRKKRIEVRKSAPQEVPFKVYIYQTKKRWLYKILPSLKDRQAKVIGEFICDKVIKTCGWRLRGNTGWCAKRTDAEEKFSTSACLTIDEIVEYAGGEGRVVNGWHISNLIIYDTPKALGEFVTVKCTNKKGSCSDCDIKPNCIQHLTRPPQSWCYVEELEE